MRKSDSKDGTYFRSGDRVFCLNGKWFYQTRENDHGPFPSRQAAQVDMQRYIEEMSFFDGVQKGTVSPDTQSPDPDFANFSLIEKD